MMNNVVDLAVASSQAGRKRAALNLADASGVATEAAAQILEAAMTLEANIDRLAGVMEQIEDPVRREACRRQNLEDRDVLRASIDDLRRKLEPRFID
jgi:hypothetical protein